MNGASSPSRTATIASSSSASPSTTWPDLISARPSPLTPRATRSGSPSRRPRSCIRRAASTAAVGCPACRLGSTSVRCSSSPCTGHSGIPSSRRPARPIQPMPCGSSPRAMWKIPSTMAAHAASAGRESARKASHAAALEPQVVLDAAEPPHGIGIGGEVVRGELLGRDGIEVRRGGGPVACRVGLPRLGQDVRCARPPLSSVDGQQATHHYPDPQPIQAHSCPIPRVMIGQPALQWLGPATFGVVGRLARPRG